MLITLCQLVVLPFLVVENRRLVVAIIDLWRLDRLRSLNWVGPHDKVSITAIALIDDRDLLWFLLVSELD
jgi:hypothetical protein